MEFNLHPRQSTCFTSEATQMIEAKTDGINNKYSDPEKQSKLDELNLLTTIEEIQTFDY